MPIDVSLDSKSLECVRVGRAYNVTVEKPDPRIVLFTSWSVPVEDICNSILKLTGLKPRTRIPSESSNTVSRRGGLLRLSGGNVLLLML